jgi:DNA (cytosine-5)-methyltransferase 1
MGGGLNGQDAYTGRILAVQSVDWYNQTTNPNINHTLGVGGDVPGVIEQKETYCLQGGGETSQSSQGSGVNKDVSFTLNGLDKHGVAYEQEGIAFEPRSADGEPRITGDIKEVVSPTLNCMGGGQREPSVVSWNGDTTPKASEDVSVTLRSQQGGEGVGVAFTASDRSNKAAWEGDISGTINCQMNSESSNLQMGVRENLTVRRLTPIECERLQGFPDNWTSEKMELTLEGNEWKATGKVVKQADGPRYKAMGNAVTVNVAEWIGKQIGKVLNETK